MTIYIVLIFFIAILCLVILSQMKLCKEGVKLSKKSKSLEILFTIVVIIILVVIQSIRTTHVGGDLYDNYADNYEIIGKMSYKKIIAGESGYEVGYALLNKIVYKIGFGNINVFLAVISILFFTSVFVFIKRFSKSPLFSVFIFVSVGAFAFSMNELRSTLALAIFLVAVTKLSKGKDIQYLILVAIAYLFHRISLLFLFYYVLMKFKNIKALLLVLGMGVLIVLVGFDYIGAVISSAFPKYRGYFNVEAGGGYTLFAFSAFILMLVIVFSSRSFWFRPKYIIKYYNYKKTKKNIKKLRNNNYLFLIMLIMAVLLQLITFKIHYFARIVVYFFGTAIAVLIPNLMYSNKFKKNTRAFAMMYVVIFVVYYLITLQEDSSGIIPYTSILGGL